MTDVTYGRLDEFLRSLGFVKGTSEEGSRVYRHPNSSALIILPNREDCDVVPTHHMVGTRMVLEAFGIMDPPEFTSRLQKAG